MIDQNTDNSSFISHPGLYTDFYQLTMGQGYYKTGVYDKKAHFDYFFREAPYGGAFVVFAGLADLLDALETFRFSDEELNWLQKKGFHRDFCAFLQSFRFDGTVTSVPEGEIVFPGEPVLTVSGSLLSCQLIETLLLNILNFQSLIATKASRLRLAAGNRNIIDFGLRRAQGTGAISASRAASIGGADATSNVLAGFRHDIPLSGTMAHSWVQSFDSELEAFRAYAHIYPETSILLIDTYDTLASGLPNAIKVGKELQETGHKLLGIRLDSGNPAKLAPKVRFHLDEAGLQHVAIAVSDQLDEHAIASLVDAGAPIDYFGVGTRLITGQPDGSLSGVYKMCSLDGKPNMKFTDEKSKSSLPGVKELVRVYDKDGMFLRDRIVLAESVKNDAAKSVPSAATPEKIRDMEDTGKRPVRDQERVIRKTMMTSGKAGAYETEIKKISEFLQTRMNCLPDAFKRISDPDCYEVSIDKSLELQIRNLKKENL